MEEQNGRTREKVDWEQKIDQENIGGGKNKPHVTYLMCPINTKICQNVTYMCDQPNPEPKSIIKHYAMHTKTHCIDAHLIFLIQRSHVHLKLLA
jgi:hypothetical protein